MGAKLSYGGTLSNKAAFVPGPGAYQPNFGI